MLVLVLMLMGRVEVYNKKSCRGFAAAFFGMAGMSYICGESP